ncbi:MAG: tyrosine-type recombinase/integrase [Lachnospiraceae bacterium]|nr:tyrosine-type recombinase/integrase [Lachnospiraceae bacterium]
MSRRPNGSGYLRNNEDGSKTLFMTYIDSKTGVRRKIQVTAKTEAACRQKIQKKLNDIHDAEAEYEEDGNCITKMTVAELCKMHLEYKVDQGLIKPSSRDRNMTTINNQIEAYKLGDIRADKLRVADVDDHFRKLFKEGVLSASSIDKAKDILNAAYNWALLRKEVTENPVAPLLASLEKRLKACDAKSADETDVRVLSPSQEKAFREEALRRGKNGNYIYIQGLCFVLLLETGMRVGELLALRWDDYDKDDGILKISKGRVRVRKGNKVDARKDKLEYTFIEDSTKNHKARNIQLTGEARRILEMIWKESPDRCSGTDYICTTHNGKPMSATDMEHRVKTIYDHAGISSEEVRGLHILRRTFATNKYRAGWDSAKIAAYIGDLESTVKKYYIADRDIRESRGKTVAYISIPEEER